MASHGVSIGFHGSRGSPSSVDLEVALQAVMERGVGDDQSRDYLADCSKLLELLDAERHRLKDLFWEATNAFLRPRSAPPGPRKAKRPSRRALSAKRPSPAVARGRHRRRGS